MSKELRDRKIEEIQEVARETSLKTVQQLTAWIYFIAWASSFDRKVEVGANEAAFNFNSTQSSYFAFSYNELKPKNFILHCQPDQYWWMIAIGVKCIIVETDGIIIVLDELNSQGLKCTSTSFKISIQGRFHKLLSIAKKNAKYAYLVEFPNINGKWTPTSIWERQIPIADSVHQLSTTIQRGSFL